jgi:catechol 2,3-dioxygenase-like lactoylglutathione lyase family enzyme
MTNFHAAAPIFRVANLAASLDYYVKALGFTIDWEYKHLIASVSRDECCIFLSEGDQGNPGSWAWIGVGDAEALHEEYRSKGAKIRNPPTNYAWAYEMQVEDLDGNVLRLGSDQKEDQPTGAWRDMRGDLWAAKPEGGWERVAGSG